YEIRVCPALQHKPPLPPPHFQPSTDSIDVAKGKVIDPFAPPYNPNLYIGELKDEETQEEFVILLNKFSVVAHHFLLVTKEFKSQASPLSPTELLQAYLFLSAARKLGKQYFAFYNCGDNSGASQPHKHIQFLPLDEDCEDGPPIEVLAHKVNIEIPDKPFSITQLSYASHTFRFPPQLARAAVEEQERVMAGAFLQLLDLAISTIRHDPTYPVGSPSYNVILTMDHLHVIPRKQEHHVIEGTDHKIAVNALGFAGMLLVKSDEELELVKKESPSKILRGVGLQSVHDILVDGTSREAIGNLL
ncbi:hypothetical protein CVT24_003343, partial [Panaeolus cyanescens]